MWMPGLDIKGNIFFNPNANMTCAVLSRAGVHIGAVFDLHNFPTGQAWLITQSQESGYGHSTWKTAVIYEHKSDCGDSTL